MKEERIKFPSVELSKNARSVQCSGQFGMNGHERERDNWILRANDTF